ncbi:MAG: hypothetical protein JWP81_3429 [Ferruginibacter sp.]|nr:hypothetical protein [Ferruginibacter sp.]
MSFLAKLVIGSTEYNILNVEYDITQPIDQNNRPNGKPKGGLINLVLESGNNNELLEWMVKHEMVKNGKIVFYRRDASSQLKTVNFTDAFCVYFKDSFTADGKIPMTTRLTLSARELKINNNIISNSWAGMKSSASTNGSGSGNDSIVSFSATD